MKNFRVTLIDRETGRMQRIRVQSECSCRMQEYVDTLTDLEISNPMVAEINEKAVAHLPLVDPATI